MLSRRFGLSAYFVILRLSSPPHPMALRVRLEAYPPIFQTAFRSEGWRGVTHRQCQYSQSEGEVQRVDRMVDFLKADCKRRHEDDGI